MIITEIHGIRTQQQKRAVHLRAVLAICAALLSPGSALLIKNAPPSRRKRI